MELAKGTENCVGESGVGTQKGQRTKAQASVKSIGKAHIEKQIFKGKEKKSVSVEDQVGEGN